MAMPEMCRMEYDDIPFVSISTEQAVAFGREESQVCAVYMADLLSLPDYAGMDEDEARFVVCSLIDHDEDYYRNFGEFVFKHFSESLIDFVTRKEAD